MEIAEEGGTLASLIEKYHDDVKADPTNLAAQATYLYAVWLNRWANDVSYTEEQQQDMDNFNESLWRRPHPNTYNYTRIASLCWNSWASDENLIPFLNRLIREDKNDAVAQYLYPGLLAASGKPILLRKAIADANEFVVGHPNLNVAHIIAGYTYYMQWLGDKDPTASKNAIDSYRTYLAEAPSNGYHRLLANGYIGFLTKR